MSVGDGGSRSGRGRGSIEVSGGPLAMDSGGSGRLLASSLGEWRVVVLGVICRRGGLVVRSTGRGAGSLVVLELGRRLEVGLLAGRRNAGRGGLVHAKGELHAVDGPGPAVVRFTLLLLLDGALLDDVGRMIAPEAWRLKLLDTPAGKRVSRRLSTDEAQRRTVPSPCRACRSCTLRDGGTRAWSEHCRFRP